MRRATSLTILLVCLLLCGAQSAAAQSFPQTEAPDRPTQRWLPLPQGDGIDLSEQAQLLQQLRDLMSNESATRDGDSPLPKLSEQQLREMEQTLENLREQIGEDKLPNLENIPKEWIDQALSDPILRKQAQQLLEQYARDRKLPSPPDRAPLNSDGVPFPRRPPNDKISSQNPKSNEKSGPKPAPNSNPNSATKSKSPNEATPSRSANGPTQNGPAQKSPTSNRPTPSGRTPSREAGRESLEDRPLPANEFRSSKSSSEEEFGQTPEKALPAHPDAERIEALQQLFKKLKTIEGQRPSETNVPKNSPSKPSSRNPNQGNLKPGNPNPSSNNQAVKPSVQGGLPNPATPRSARNNSPKPMNPTPERAPDGTSISRPSTELPSRDSGNDPIFDPSPFTQDSDSSDSSRSDLGRPAPSKSTESLANPSGQRTAGSRPSGTPGSRQNANGSSSSDRSDRTPNAWPTSPNENQAPRSPNSSIAPEVDIKTQLERHGLGRALKSIVEKTLKEQDPSKSVNKRPEKSANAQSQTKDNRTANKASAPATSSVPSSTKATPSRPAPQNPNGIANNNATGMTPNPPTASNQNPNSSSTMSGLRDMAAQFWGAIRSTPGESGGGSSAVAPNVSGGGLGEFGFAWSGRTWLLLALILVGIAMLFLLARKRIEQATAAREAEAELAKEILTEGIRTRADVVRAFHRFVLRRAQPVATWWNHRYVASRLTESSPQLRSVISDLASVYEHARYLPPEVALTSDEIDRVQAALKQCAACSV